MQELEKILEEIDNLYVDETDFGIECNMENRSNIACDNCYECIKEACKNIIRKHMNDGWLSVEERLPEEGEKVLVWYEYFRYGEYNRMYEMYGIGWQYDGHWSGDVSGTKAKCIAWQPLPEPYRTERSEK